jgi:TolB-like protein/Tfp pilus assembly protein PilF
MNLPQLIEELKRRNVFKVATAYAIAGWLIIQVVTIIEAPLALPDWFDTMVIVLLGIGFPLALIFAWAFELTPDGIKKSVEVEQQVSILSQTGKKLNGLTTAILIATVVFLMVERLFFAPHAMQEEIAELTNLPTSEAASIAVLPFVNMSEDQGNEYFSDGLSEELLNALAKLKKIKVAGRTSSFKFKGENQNLSVIASELGVNHILEGSVRKAGGRVRITAQLVQARDGFHMWSQSYDRELTTTNIFDIQEEIARQVLQELKVRLLPEEQAQLQAAPTQDIEAYQLYLKANQLVVDRNIDEMEAAIELYKEALRMDPGFASAHARLAIAYNLQWGYGNISLEENQALMKRQIELALGMDTNLAEGYAALGLYEHYEGNLKAAAVAFEKGLALNPNFIESYNWLALLYSEEYLNEEKKQLALYKQGYEIDPLNPFAIINRAHASALEGKKEEVEDYVEKNLRINPDFLNTYRYYAFIKMHSPFGQMDEAVKNLDFAYSQRPKSSNTIIAYGLVVLTFGRTSNWSILLWGIKRTIW